MIGTAVLGASGVAAQSAGAATFNVINEQPSGAGSLADAVSQASGNGGAVTDVITFDSSVHNINLTGPLVTSTPISVQGPGAGQLTVKGAAGFPIFSFGTDLEVSGMTLTGGAHAFTMESGNDLTVRNSVLTGNHTSGDGGAIYQESGPQGGSVTVVGSTLSGNSSDDDGGAIFVSNGVLTVTDSTLSGNTAGIAGPGGTSGDGGAIRAASPTAATTAVSITGSRIDGNKATGRGGGLFVNNAGGDMAVERSTVSGNTASGGGGLYFGYGMGLAINSSTISGNSSSSSGGGMYVYAPRKAFTIKDSTVADNSTLLRGGGVNLLGRYDKPVTFTSSTIVGNIANGAGSGIFQYGSDRPTADSEGVDVVALQNTIVANNLGQDLAQGPTPSSPFLADFSLIGNAGSVPVTETTPGSNKLNVGIVSLPALADNGGPTQTILPPADSPVVDAGSAFGLAQDQRGLARTVDQPTADASGSDGTDIGAVELADTTLDGAHVSAKKKQKEKGKKIVIAVSAGASEGVTATADGSAKVGKKQIALTVAPTSVAAGQSATLKLKPSSKKGTRKIAKRLGSGKKVKVAINVTLTDAAANSATQPVTVKLSEKGKKPH
jgi:hypothetical protein